MFNTTFLKNKNEKEKMKIDLEFSLKNNIIPIEYHSFIVSFFKKALEAYDENMYYELYQDGNTALKTFTFATYFDSPQFLKDQIILGTNKLIVHITDYDMQDGILLGNALRGMGTIAFPLRNNQMKLNRVTIGQLTYLNEDNIIIQMSSPLIVRNHNRETNQDIYYTYQDTEFKETLKMNLNSMLQKLEYPISVDDFDIVPLKNKKTVVKLYHHSINASLGVFQLKGNPQLLDFLWKAGIGSHRSSGFGSFKILK